jgi:hypothetical protein
MREEEVLIKRNHIVVFVVVFNLFIKETIKLYI